MKKVFCLLISIVMLLLMAASAMAAISASWSNDRLTVSTTDTTGMNMVFIDGKETGRFVGDTSPSQTFSFPADGKSHTVTTVAYWGASGGSASFVAGEAPDPTEAPATETPPTEAPPTVAPPTVAPPTEAPATEVPPTEAPATEVPPTEAPATETPAPATPTPAPEATATIPPKTGPLAVSVGGYEGVRLTFSVNNLAPLPGEAWVDGVSTGITVNNGSNTINIILKEGPHTLTIHGNGETASASFQAPAPKQPVISGAKYADGVLSFNLANLNGLGEIWVSGQNAGTSSGNGSNSVSIALKPGDYTVMVHDPMFGLSSNTASFHVHDIVPDGEAKEPTCTETGLTVGEKCSLCGEIVKPQEVIPALGHKVEWTKGQEATCTEAGFTDSEKCTVCGTILKAQEVIPALGHDWDEWKVTKEAKVNVPGEETRVCKNDPAHVETRPIDALSEDWDEGKVTKEPTCEEEGVRTYTSKNDPTLTKEVAIPALGHKAETVPGKEPTCTEKGLTEGEKCSVCGKMVKEQEEIPALGHQYIPQKSDSLTKKEYVCSRCGKSVFVKDYEPIENLYGSILRNALGEYVDYFALCTEQEKNTLIIRALVENKAGWVSEIGMYLNQELIDSFRQEGFDKITYENENAAITVALDDLKPELYETDGKISEYAVILDPKAEGGCLVRLEAILNDASRIEAKVFPAMQLDWNEQKTEISAAGIY